MQDDTSTTLHCLDCGKGADEATVTVHPGAVSAPSDEGHVRTTLIALCESCAQRRVEAQEPTFV